MGARRSRDRDTASPIEATRDAMELLMRKDYTVRQLTDKLQRRGYTEVASAAALEYVRGCGYLDDVRYAREYTASRMTRRSMRRIENDLRERGIDRDVYAPVLAEAFADRDAERTAIRALLIKKHFDPAGIHADRDSYDKLFASICRQGFPPALVREEMRGF